LYIIYEFNVYVVKSLQDLRGYEHLCMNTQFTLKCHTSASRNPARMETWLLAGKVETSG